MLNDTQKKNLNRVMKLLQMTEANGCTAQEAESAKLQAQKLMDKHNLSANDMATADIKYDKGLYLIIDGDEDEYTYTVIPMWRKLILQYVSQSFGVSILFTTDDDGDHMFIRSGTDVDVEVSIYCDQLIAKQIIELAEEYRVENGIRRNSKEINAFLYTISSTVTSNLKEMLEGIQSPGKSKNSYEEALARKEKALAKYVGDTGARVSTSRSKGRYSAAGADAAGRVSVNGAVGGGRQARRIGA